jgi:hypothetical protein
MATMGHRFISQSPETGKGDLNDSHTEFAGNVGSPVGASRINENDFIRPQNALQSGSDLVLLIESQNIDG